MGVSPVNEIIPLCAGEAEMPRAIDRFWGLGRDGLMTVPILCFLVLTATGPILVDAGPRDPERGARVHGLPPHRPSSQGSLSEQLQARGLKPGDVTAVVFTHLHHDHAGGCELFPAARFYVQRRELAAAAAPLVPPGLTIGGGGLFYDRADVSALRDRLWNRVVLLEGPEELAPGVRLVPYFDSHTPGSQVVYVEGDNGVTAIVGDIVRSVAANLDTGIPPAIYYNLEPTLRALREIKTRATAAALPTHDPAVLTAFGLPWEVKA